MLEPIAKAGVPKDKLRLAVYATIDAFKQGCGVGFSQFEEILNRLYPQPPPAECELCGRLICDGHIGEGFQ